MASALNAFFLKVKLKKNNMIDSLKELRENYKGFLDYLNKKDFLKQDIATISAVSSIQEDWIKRIHVVIKMPESYYQYDNDFSTADQMLSLRESISIEKRKIIYTFLKKHKLGNCVLLEQKQLENGSVLLIYGYAKFDLALWIKMILFTKAIIITLLLYYFI